MTEVDLEELVAMAIWEKRREMAIPIELEPWGDGSIPRANHVFEEARAAMQVIAENDPTR